MKGVWKRIKASAVGAGKLVISFFPIQLLFLQIKKNQVLLICWVILFAVIFGYIGSFLGVQYLFLDPEYLNQVNFVSFFIVGVALGGFTVAYNITCYILDGHKFRFLGTLMRPFSKFSLNNSLLPATFIITYTICIIDYQNDNELISNWELMERVAGFWSGFIAMLTVLYVYFLLTNKDIFKVIVVNLDHRLKQVNISRGKVMRKWYAARKEAPRVKYYIDLDLKLKAVQEKHYFDKEFILKVFDQNHFNSVVIELLLLVLIFVLGIFKDFPAFQLPAAASGILFLTIVVMFTGAISYWFRGWSLTATIAILLIINFLLASNRFTKIYPAFGLNYQEEPISYNLETIKAINRDAYIQEDITNTKKILENWKSKQAVNKPYALFIAASGGGLRAALWTMVTLQHLDSISNGRLMDQTILITGASGGLLGASYFRELVLREQTNPALNPYSPSYAYKLSNDNLNPLIFNILVSDAFAGFQHFNYAGSWYPKDRGYTFEWQLNINTEFFLNKPLIAYQLPEQQARIPMLLISPTIINDGRKLFISPQHMSYMSKGFDQQANVPTTEKGVDFRRFFQKHHADSLRFLSALRMAATFPYITPNVTLPSEPGMEIMDSGISDNFGISDALRFLFIHQDWIQENTRGVLIISIRDSDPNQQVRPRGNKTLLDQLTTPISNVYNNFENIQNVNNDNKLEFALDWFEGPIHRVNLIYQPRRSTDNAQDNEVRASLNWRLTGREKESVMESIFSPGNQAAVREIETFLDAPKADSLVMENVP